MGKHFATDGIETGLEVLFKQTISSVCLISTTITVILQIPFFSGVPMSFETAIIEFPAKHLIGMKTHTNLQKAQADCPAIWQTFGHGFPFPIRVACERKETENNPRFSRHRKKRLNGAAPKRTRSKGDRGKESPTRGRTSGLSGEAKRKGQALARRTDVRRSGKMAPARCFPGFPPGRGKKPFLRPFLQKSTLLCTSLHKKRYFTGIVGYFNRRKDVQKPLKPVCVKS